MNPRRLLLAVATAIVLQPAAGQSPPKIVEHGAAPAVSPDGARIAFLSDRDGAQDVYVIGADGTGEIRLTHTPEAESQPAWSADGKQIWFTVFANDSSAIYSIGANGGDPKRIGAVPGRPRTPLRGARRRRGLLRHLRFRGEGTPGSDASPFGDGRSGRRPEAVAGFAGPADLTTPGRGERASGTDGNRRQCR